MWAGGTILSYPSWHWFIVCLCRASDKDRAPRFYNTLKIFHAEGIMGDLNDDPEQKLLDEKDLEHAIINLLPQKNYDLIISHNPTGEYTRHLRHEEISRAVIKLWYEGKISTNELWTFAYRDSPNERYPIAVKTANIYHSLDKKNWLKKYSIITETFGFDKNSWEAKTTPKEEAFWKFSNSSDAMNWLQNGGILKSKS